MLAILLLLAVGSAWAQDPAAPPPEDDAPSRGALHDRYEALIHNAVRWDDARRIAGATVQDTYGQLTLADGLAAPVRTEGGELLGFAWVGDCLFSYRPPAGIEQESMKRLTGHPALSSVPCTEAFVLTGDARLFDAIGLQDAPVEPLEPTPWLKKQRRQQKVFKRKGRFAGGLAWAMTAREAGVVELGEDRLGYLEAAIKIERRVRIRPAEAQADRIDWMRVPGGLLSPAEPAVVGAAWTHRDGTKGTTILTSHPLKGGVDDERPAPNLAMEHLDLTVAIDAPKTANVAKMTATATLRVRPRHTAQQALRLSLARQIRARVDLKTLGFGVESIVDEQGRALDFVHEGNDLLVALRKPIPAGQASTLTVTYGGDGLARTGDGSFSLLANYPWYPQTGRGERYSWTVDLCFPKELSAAGSGTTVSSELRDEQRCERWDEPNAMLFPAINLGRWTAEEAEGPRGIKLRGFMLDQSDHMLDDALGELGRMLPFFEELFGPYPYAELDLAQAHDNMFFWQAPAGLIEVSATVLRIRERMGKTQRSDYYPRVNTATLAHELGHQWWGHVVGWADYRSQWVSETFAEYASFLYMVQHYGKQSYFGRLEWWEANALESDDYGPPVLGARLGPDRVGQFYRRGPYALHMLRRQVGDEAFLAWMKTITTAVAQKNLDNVGLMLITEHVLGPQARAMLERWVLRSGIPALKATYAMQGRTLSLTLEQTQGGEPFPLLVPIELRSKGTTVVHDVYFDGPSVTVELPLPPGKFKALKIDPGREVLASARQVAVDK